MHIKDAQHYGIDTMISCHSDGTGIDSYMMEILLSLGKDFYHKHIINFFSFHESRSRIQGKPV